MLRRTLVLLAALALPCTLSAQKISGQVGVGFTAANPDYSNAAIKGVAFYGNYDIGPHLGLTVEINDLKLFTPRDIGEATYLYGLRYQVRKARFHPYAKGLFGLATFEYQKGLNPTSTALRFPAYAIGAGVDFNLRRHINVRLIDLEYQFLPGFSPHGLTPFAGTVGAAYRF